jgi:hypothetical protein
MMMMMEMMMGIQFEGVKMGNGRCLAGGRLLVRMIPGLYSPPRMLGDQKREGPVTGLCMGAAELDGHGD